MDLFEQRVVSAVGKSLSYCCVAGDDNIRCSAVDDCPQFLNDGACRLIPR